MTQLEYMILKATDSNTLEQLVREHLDQGWRPVGGVCVSRYSTVWFYQAVLLEHDVPTTAGQRPPALAR